MLVVYTLIYADFITMSSRSPYNWGYFETNYDFSAITNTQKAYFSCKFAL